MNAVEKALELLTAFDDAHPTWGVRELGAHFGFSPATVQRNLQALKKYHFVDQDSDTRQYRLGPAFFRFIGILQNSNPITRAAPPFMSQLLTTTQETVHLNVVQGYDRICIDHLESPQHLKASMPIGNRSPLYAGASSKCLLAFSTAAFVEQYLQETRLVALTDKTITSEEALRSELAAIRSMGYALSLGERTPGLGSLSAPILDHRDRLIAALSLAIPEIRFKDDLHRKICLRQLIQAARDFSRFMGFQAS
jgi:DNA-binding IclR family transcriptional regulator